MKRVLMIAYHFPPLAGSSGIQRTLRFVQQLPALGWQPLVLTAQPRAYERTADDLLGEVPSGTVVRRAFALDATRHLAWRGRYLAATARPDRWASWRFDAVRQGLAMIREHRPQMLWSTYPIATAHVIGAELQRRTGLPWVADFRDPMAQPDYPPDAQTHAHFLRIEALATEHAAAWCLTTPGALKTYRERYPVAASRMCLLENGYDEPSFARAEAQRRDPVRPLDPERLTLLHSGIVYPSERDPTQLFEALAALRSARPALAARLRIRFRAAVAEDLLRRLTAQHELDEMVEVLPSIGYDAALREMLDADGLLLMQASNCNEQVPAKAYEYLRARRPIVCLSDPAGDTWKVLSGAGVTAIARLDNADEIAALLARFAEAPADEGWRARSQAVAAASRQARSVELASLLDGLA
jgi:hypothetical protein